MSFTYRESIGANLTVNSTAAAFRHIDSIEFANQGGRLEGEVALADLPRVCASLFETAGMLRFALQGGRDGQGRPCLDLAVAAGLRLRCERCLEGLDYALDAHSRLLLVAPGAPWPDDEAQDDAADAIEALHEQPITDLIEDETLLALPLAPRHEEGQCRLRRADEVDAENAKPSPFAALAKLKTKN